MVERNGMVDGSERWAARRALGHRRADAMSNGWARALSRRAQRFSTTFLLPLLFGLSVPAAAAAGESDLYAPLPAPEAIEEGTQRGGAAGAEAAVGGWAQRIEIAPPSHSSGSAAAPRDRSGDGATRDKAEATYRDAMAAFDAGRLDEAQSLFESIVANASHTDVAMRARAQLATLYRKSFPPIGVAPAGAVLVPAQPTAPGAATAKDGGELVPSAAANGAHAALAAVRDPDVEGPMEWRSNATRTERFEALMRSEAGDRIFFGLESADIGTRARTVIERQARWLTRFPELYILIEGHADEPGDLVRNRTLSMARAKRVKQLLVSSGVAPARVDIEALGQRQRIAECDGSTCQAQNRRAVTRLYVVLPRGANTYDPRRTRP